MATFTITASQNIDELTGKTGGDIYNINGGTLTIDQHSRFGLNNANTSATAATSMGSITLSATLGGTCNIDGRYVRLIPFTGGSGTIPALNSLVTQGGASGKLMCVYSSLTSAPLINGGTMPATGWIQIKQWNSVEYSSGALTLSGVAANASGASLVGFLEINGDEASTVNANRLGTFNVTGAWYKVGVTSGVSNQTMQIPNNGTLRHIAGVFIEKNAGQKDYEFYPNAGTATTTGTEEARGKVVWIDNTGLVRIGNSGAATNGYTPPEGLEVVVGNIFFTNVTTASRNVVVIPNAAVATRYDFTTTGGGVINIDKCDMAWYLSCSQAYSVTVSNSGFIDGIWLSEVASPISINNIGVGNKPTTALVMAALSITLCSAGGTIQNSIFRTISQSSSGNSTAILTDLNGFSFINTTFTAGTIKGNATVYSVNATRVSNSTFTRCKILQAPIALTTCSDIDITDTIYIDAISGLTVSTYSTFAFIVGTGSLNITISGLTYPVINNHPYGGILYINPASCKGIKLRNIGTRVSPLNMGTALASGIIYGLGVGAFASNIKIQRVYVINTRTGIMTGDNSSSNIIEENVWGDYADAVDVMACINHSRKGMRGTGALTAQVSVYGTHWRDGFTSTTAGRIAILMNETTSLTSSQVTLANGANFTSAGGLYMPTIGMSTTFETPYYILGHTAFTNTALVMAGGTATNYTYEYAIDKNDGAGWSAMTTANYTATTLGTALSGITGIDASKGFKLRLKITTGTTNTTAITSVYVTTTSTTTAQDYQYPLDVITLTLTGLAAGSDIVILNAGTEVERVNVDSNPTTSYNYIYETTGNVDIKVYKRGYIPFSIMNYSLSSSNASLPVAQVADRNYIE